MVRITPTDADPTMDAMNAALVEKSRRQARRPYLGMSSLGRECARQLWYGFRWVQHVVFDAATLKRFADGFAQEDVMAERLRAIEGLTLETIDPATNYQFGCADFGGHLKGHADGKLLGLLQAPKTWHLWEHKSVNEKKFAKLQTLKMSAEKMALQQWDQTYYGQHVLYMDYMGLKRGYLTCTTPGGRDEIGVRTEADKATATRLKKKAERIIFSDAPPDKISPTADFYLCRWCDHANICHHGGAADRNCRTCVHVTPRREGGWQCEHPSLAAPAMLTEATQAAGCAWHRYNPALVPGEVVEATVEAVVYRMKDGSEWRDGA